MSRYDRKARNFLAFAGIRGLVTQTKKTINRMKIYGEADIVTRQGGYMDMTGHSNTQYIRIKPKKKWSWEIDEPIFVEGRFNVKRAKDS